LPSLLVDLRHLKVIDWEQFKQLETVLSLDSPYAEALLHQFARYVGRLGTPDLDTDLLLETMTAKAGETDSTDA
jgi:hypothetical protein